MLYLSRSMGDKCFLQKCFDSKKSCDCQYYIHNTCFINYLDHSIKQKKDISCIVCKSEIITYDVCMYKTNVFYKKAILITEKILMIMKIIALTLITSTFIQLLIQTL